MISQLKFQKIDCVAGNKWEAKVNYGRYVIKEFGKRYHVYFFFLNRADHSWCKLVKDFIDPVFACEKECQKRHEWFVDLVSQNKGE